MSYARSIPISFQACFLSLSVDIVPSNDMINRILSVWKKTLLGFIPTDLLTSTSVRILSAFKQSIGIMTVTSLAIFYARK